MHILIIGGTGRISTPLTDGLVQLGHKVTLLNRGKSEKRHHAQHGVVTNIICDRTKYSEFEACISQCHSFDVVIDMVAFNKSDAESAVRVFNGRIKQYIFCSAVAVYSTPPLYLPVKESHEREPTINYGRGKKACEEVLLEAHDRGDFAITIIRPANTYGEGGGLVSTFDPHTHFIDRIRRQLPIIIHGDGNSLWSNCHIDDVARTFISALGNAKAYGRCYNVCGNDWMTWNTYYSDIAVALGLKADGVNAVYIPSGVLGKMCPAEAMRVTSSFRFNRIFDSTAAMNDLGFTQTISFRNGVAGTIAWLEKKGKIETAESFPLEDELIRKWETHCLNLSS